MSIRFKAVLVCDGTPPFKPCLYSCESGTESRIEDAIDEVRDMARDKGWIMAPLFNGHLCPRCFRAHCEAARAEELAEAERLAKEGQ